MGTASIRRWSWAGHLVPLGLWILSTVIHVGHASYGSLKVTSVIPASAKEIVTDTDTLSCITLTRGSTSIDIKFAATVNTFIAYTQHDSDAPGSEEFPVQITWPPTPSNESFSFRAGDTMVYVWSGYHPAGPNQRVMLEQKSESSTAARDLIVCEVKAYDVTLSEYCTCDDPCSRNTDYICNASSVCKTPPAGCDTENLALYKSANMSSRYSKSGDASLAVNGNTGTTYNGPGYTNDSTQWNCIHTHPDDNAPYWQVDLGRNYLIERVTIFHRSGESGKDRMTGTKVTVDDKLCDGVLQTIPWQEKIELNCKPPVQGRIVRISRNGPFGAYGFSMNLCEVQVWGCEAEQGQTQCRGQCGHCKSEHCNESTRKCSQCEDGWYTPRCNVKCGHCLHGKCDQTNGNCTESCEAGWYSPQCTVGCSSRCKDNVCDQNTGNCTKGCENGWYLDQCNKRCSSHCQQSNCDQYTGNCKPCKENWAGDRCDGCVPGKYGGKCNQSCGKGCELTSRVCQPENGQCDCRSGWDPTTIPSCNAECPRKKYGLNCSSTCGQGCGDECNKTTGHCQCEPGWTTELCDRRCEKGLYGANCAKSCSEGCVENSCNDTTGHCDLGCGPGWNHSDPLCDLKCSPGSYGHNCNMTCGHCRGSTGCRHDTGHCSGGCAEGLKGNNCRDELVQEEGGTGAGVAAFITVLLLIIVTSVVVVFVIRHRRRRGNEAQKVPNRDGDDGGPLYVNCPEPPVYFESYGTGNQEADGGEQSGTVHGSPIYSLPSTSALSASRPQSTVTEAKDADDDEVDEDESDEAFDEDRYSVYQSLKLHIDQHQKYLLERLTSADLVAEFKTLPGGLQYAHDNGSVEENKAKNRFKRIIPYDHSRVVLTKQGNDPFSDYINANYIKDDEDEKAYIATQGPLAGTVGDFWRMVWQERVTQIVMLTNLTEKTKVKCHQYWPEKGHQKKHGGITVSGVDVQLRADFFTRTFLLKAASGGERTVTQYQMVVWPDHGVPTVFSLVNLWRYIKARTDHNSGPLLVHCSAGVGRTGTYIALDILMDMLLKQQKPVNIAAVAMKLRDDRVVMIQAVDQYVFLHEALLEAYTARDTRLTLDKFDAVFPQGVGADKSTSRIDTEFKNLTQMKNFLSKPKYTMADMEENRGKNRNSQFLPDDNHLMYLTVHMPGRNQYINAVSMPSFRQQRGMLLTQLPLPDTVVDMWRLVEGCDVTTIVSISAKHEERRKDYCQYWPHSKGSPKKCGPYTIKLISTDSLGNTLTSYSLQIENTSGKSREVRVLHYSGWGVAAPEETSDLLRLLELLDMSHGDAKDRPFIVQCWDGATKSGLFCTLYNVISRVTYDREVDVYLTARHAQSIHPKAVTSKDQYFYGYLVVQEYRKVTDVYANS